MVLPSQSVSGSGSSPAGQERRWSIWVCREHGDMDCPACFSRADAESIERRVEVVSVSVLEQEREKVEAAHEAAEAAAAFASYADIRAEQFRGERDRLAAALRAFIEASSAPIGRLRVEAAHDGGTQTMSRDIDYLYDAIRAARAALADREATNDGVTWQRAASSSRYSS